MKVGIIGNGVVGNATAKSFDGLDVRCYDVNPARSTHGICEAVLSDVVFVCLPTPQRIGSMTCNLDYIHEFFCRVATPAYRNANYVLRSTVPIGTTASLSTCYNLPNLVHSPEFLTVRTAVEDARNPVRLIIGSPIRDSKGERALRELYLSRFRCPIYGMHSDESEAVKLVQNGFSAVKIAFFNEIRALCDRRGLQWNVVMESLLAGGWINQMHTQVPGPDGKRGFGGSCLPKDLANLITCIKDAGLDCDVCLAACDRNKRDRNE